jgi:GNAT superfamily N-acetyltransferase
MDLIVARTPDRWTARHGESVVGQAVAFVRPDGRCFVAFRSCRAEAYRPLVQAIAEHLRRDLHTEIDDADAEVRDRLMGLGFVISRRDHIHTIPTDPTVTGLSNVAVPAGLEVVTADWVDEDLLRELDDELKQDVPGADGWKWDRQGFRKETYDAPDFDPATYLVAIEQASGHYAGLVRVWNRPSGPRLGLIAVRRPYRRRGLARSLLAQAFGVLHDRGKAEVAAEVDVTNTGPNRLFAGLGAWRIGGSIELIRPWSGGTA